MSTAAIEQDGLISPGRERMEKTRKYKLTNDTTPSSSSLVSVSLSLAAAQHSLHTDLIIISLRARSAGSSAD